jgi:hypothetical protein
MVLSWDKLVTHDNNPPVGTLHRDPIHDDAYNVHRAVLFAKGISVEKHIVENVMNGSTVALTPNEFPYLTEPDIKHLVLWMLPGSEMTHEEAKSYVSKALNTSLQNVVLFENMVANKSIKAIPHFQVFLHMKA